MDCSCSAANERAVRLRRDHAADRKRYHHCFERVGEMGAIPAPQAAHVHACASMLLQGLGVKGQEAGFVGAADYGVKRGSKKISNVPYAFSEAHKLPVEQAGPGFAPKHVARVAIMVHERLRCVGKEVHYLAAQTRIAHGLLMKG